MASGAAEILGEEWVLAGKGASTRLVRAPVGWWLQFVGYEDTRLGRLIAYNTFLGRPPQASQSGDGPPTISDHFIMPNDSYPRSFEDMQTPQMVAEWVTAVTHECFSRRTNDLPVQMNELEDVRVSWESSDIDPFEGAALQWLVSMRVVCGSRSRDDLIDDIDAVLADPFLEASKPYASTRKNPRTYQEYFTALRGAVASGDRGAVESVVREARTDSLRLLGVPDAAIGDVVFPEPQVSL
ncbi:hypothetical protein QNM97_06490 [Gordonia sp. L191]|uniref:hypothetical protein n=1 Tax=Gordonia sp. L191 TaxID=2982699 RepID=UPI0024C0920B|nr:hypothetical protein [Gordonia sp. L191]WHU48641.1 hypothetical protein QNM97_06490 [Gordonia sp. L191]